MYCSFYGLKERPFTLTPNPEFIFLGTAHQEAFAHLLYGIGQKAGFIALTGEVGAGKTTVIRTLLTRLEPEKHATALILNPVLSVMGLLKTINREFGISDNGAEPAELVDHLNLFLLEQKKLNKTVVLVIDEAQDMEPATLEQVRLLSNLETATEKLIQIILVGQPELETLLGREDMRQLNQRITVRYHVSPMNLHDTRDYLTHRLRAANSTPDLIRFNDSAAKLIHRFAEGLPRLVNAVADRALLIGYNQELRQIDEKVIRQAIKEVAPADARKRRALYRKYLIAASVMISILLVTGTGIWLYQQLTATDMHKTAEKAVPSATVAKPEDIILQQLKDASERQNGVQTIIKKWNLAIPDNMTDGTIEAVLKRSGLDTVRYAGNLGGVARLGYPALLEISISGEKRYLPLLGLENENIITNDQTGRSVQISGAKLEPYWSGRAIIPFINSYRLLIPTPYSANEQQRLLLVNLLQTAGIMRQQPITYFTEDNVRDALKHFQQQNRLEADGLAGGQTVLLLYSKASSNAQPDPANLEKQQP